MIAKYFVYKKGGSSEPFISCKEMPAIFFTQKRKYTGKQLKIETIRRVFNVKLDETLTSSEVNDYIGANIWHTIGWKKYLHAFEQIGNEIEPIKETYTLQYLLNVELEDFVKVGKDNVQEPVNLSDYRILFLLKNELMGCSLEMYKTMINPILSIEKDYNTIL